MFSQICLLLLLAQTPQLMGKSSRNRQRHNRAATVEKAPMECVADYCLPHDYNALELPSSDRQDVQINLEVIFFLLWNL